MVSDKFGKEMNQMFLIPTIILTVVIFKIYHKIFNVTYFGLSAVMKEIVTMFIISMLICYSILN